MFGALSFCMQNFLYAFSIEEILLPPTIMFSEVEGKLYKGLWLRNIMVYIYKKLIGRKPYYYLRISERKGKRVITKDLAYLGSSISDVKKALGKLDKYKSQIRKAHYKIIRFLESNYYYEKASELKLKRDKFLEGKEAPIEACKIHFNKVFRKLDELTKKEIFKNFLIEFAYNTTTIEGNTIDLEQAKNLLEKGRTPENKTLREIYDLQNHEEIFFELLGSKEDINHDLIIKIHKGLMKNIDKRIGYRSKDIRVIKRHFESSPGKFVNIDMKLLLKWYNENKKLHPLVLATIFHHKFEKIHPFSDGNGRTGRMLLNYILMINGYPLLIVHNKTRTEYLEVLGDSDKSGLNTAEKEEYSSLVNYIADEMINYYWDFFL
jgi:fido (protein-threonine AMPylation protein)